MAKTKSREEGLHLPPGLFYFLGGLLSLPPPEGLPVVLGHPALFLHVITQTFIVTPTLFAFRLPHLSNRFSSKPELDSAVS
jgi:hypothetical protein